jgi:hypothetical protein
VTVRLRAIIREATVPDWTFLDEDPNPGPPEEIEGQEAMISREDVAGRVPDQEEPGEDPPPIEDLETGGRT